MSRPCKVSCILALPAAFAYQFHEFVQFLLRVRTADLLSWFVSARLELN